MPEQLQFSKWIALARRIGAEGVIRHLGCPRILTRAITDLMPNYRRAPGDDSVGIGHKRRISPEPVIGPRLARTRWAPIRRTGCPIGKQGIAHVPDVMRPVGDDRLRN